MATHPEGLTLEAFRGHLLSIGPIQGQPQNLGIVGYSGGADSAALVDLLHRAGVNFVAAHLHHGMRAEADQELEQCKAFCAERNIPFVSGRANVPQIAKEMKVGLEEAGRHARYHFFHQAKAQFGAAWIATAHTQTDHVETILLNILRGTGLNGLAGIHAVRDDLVRPLLTFTRDQTRGYCQQQGLWFHDDPANTDPQFARSRLRNLVHPELLRINPAYEEAIVRLSEIAREEDDMLHVPAGRILAEAEQKPNGDLQFLTDGLELNLNLNILLHAPAALQRRAIRLAAEVLGASLSYEPCKRISQALAARKPGSITAEGGDLVVEWDDETMVLRRLDAPSPQRYTLEFPGEIDSISFGWTLSIDVLKRLPLDQEPQQRRSLQALIDARKLRLPLHIRAIEPGDRMTPLGFNKARKISDLVGEAKLTATARKVLPLICDLVGPIWIPGVCLDDRVKTTPESTDFLWLQFSQSQPETGS